MANDRLTNFYVDYNIEDTTAKEDATFVTEDEQQYFTNISRLVYPNTKVTLDRFTFEHNFNILDGSRSEMENNSNNELTFSYVSRIVNSIIFEEDTDCAISANSSSRVDHEVSEYSKSVLLDAGHYYLTGCPANGSDSTYKMSAGGVIDYGNGAEFTLSEQTEVTLTITIAENYFAEGLIFYPVISQTEPSYVQQIIPYFNDTLSDSEGEYEENPKITINFTREHASIAFRMLFIDDHPLEVKMTFYNLEGDMLTSFYQPIVSNAVLVERDVDGYAKIELEFTKTLPNRYVKMTSFIFGVVITWDETNVRNATLVQQIDRLSKNIAIDTLSFTVIDVTSDLNLGNPEGMHRYFQNNQYMLPYEVVNGRTIQLGKYYLKTFSESTNLGKMSAQSYLGIMDEVTFNDGEVYNGTQAGTVIEQIFYAMGLSDYTIDAETYEQPLYGTITPKSCRKALNEVLFATNSVINAHDMENIIIKKTSQVQRPDIPRDSKFTTTVAKKNYTFGVDVKYTSYIKDEEPKEIIKATYEAGTHTVYFTQPYTNLSIEGATIDTEHTNFYYVTFTVSDVLEQEVTISGYGYSTITNSQKATQNKLKAGEEEKIVNYNTNLCNQKTAKELATKILTYLNYDLTIKIKWLADGNDMGDLHIVENPVLDFNDYYGVFTKRSFDLTGGFIDTAEMDGTTLKHSFYKYMREEADGIEVYSGEDDGLI